MLQERGDFFVAGLKCHASAWLRRTLVRWEGNWAFIEARVISITLPQEK